MDYRDAFAISASGMNVEKLRLDITAINLANVHSTKGADGKPFRPLHVVSVEAATGFGAEFESMAGAALRGARVASIEKSSVPPRMVYEPGHPDADAKGFVTLPGVNQITEMVNMATALRAYQANVVAMNATKSMALQALKLGDAQ